MNADKIQSLNGPITAKWINSCASFLQYHWCIGATTMAKGGNGKNKEKQGGKKKKRKKKSREENK